MAKQMRRQDEEEMNRILSGFRSNEMVRQMKQYVQHGNVSTYDHCENVARLSYRINERLHLHCDLNVLLAGAMLHDFYLYDWHRPDGGSHRLHGFRHARAAADKAKEVFGIDWRTEQVIASHMWPLNIGKIPGSREAWVVCIADKCASLYETVFRR